MYPLVALPFLRDPLETLGARGFLIRAVLTVAGFLTAARLVAAELDEGRRSRAVTLSSFRKRRMVQPSLDTSMLQNTAKRSDFLPCTRFCTEKPSMERFIAIERILWSVTCMFSIRCPCSSPTWLVIAPVTSPVQEVETIHGPETGSRTRGHLGQQPYLNTYARPAVAPLVGPLGPRRPPHAWVAAMLGPPQLAY